MRTRLRTLAITAASAAGLWLGGAWAGGTDLVFGWVEMAELHPWGVQAKAKLDTGALTSSMHAENIERFERDGAAWVRFTVELEDEATGEQVSKRFERPLHRNVIIRGAAGEERRPVVLMRICLGRKIYEEQFSLEDRDDMLYPILVGRRTIQHLGVVDVTRTFMNEPRCDEDSPVSKHEGREPDGDIGI